MKNMKRILSLSLLIFFLLSPYARAQDKTWKIDPAHTGVTFTAEYMSVTDVEGKFTEFFGTVFTTGTSFDGAEVNMTIQASSIDTDNDKRDGHLQSEDFLYVEKYPEIKFKSLSFIKETGDNYKVRGALTIRGITKTEVFDVIHKGTIDMGDQERAGFTLTGTINRFDYGVDWSKSFAKGLVVGEEIKIKCDVLLLSGK